MKQKLNRTLLALLGALLPVTLLAAPPAPPPPPGRPGLTIAVAANASPEIRQAAASILAAVSTQPLLKVMAGDHPPAALADSVALADGKPPARAYTHLVVIGLPDDPLITAGWQREALYKGDDFYVFGFGHLKGDIGYIESGRNPFLHSRWIPTAPYETEMVTITGSTPAGVALAAQAFIDKDLVNGVVAGRGWQRGAPNLLERNPLDPTFTTPPAPDHLGDWTKIGVTQAGEDVYRGVEQDTGVEPQEIWEIKYYKPGVWDAPGAAAAFKNYSAGLHRRAYGNTLWMARFKSADEAAAAVLPIARPARLGWRKGGSYAGLQPYYGFTNPDEVRGPLNLWRRGAWILMSTLPPNVVEAGLGQPAAVH